MALGSLRFTSICEKQIAWPPDSGTGWHAERRPGRAERPCLWHRHAHYQLEKLASCTSNCSPCKPHDCSCVVQLYTATSGLHDCGAHKQLANSHQPMAAVASATNPCMSFYCSCHSLLLISLPAKRLHTVHPPTLQHLSTRHS